MNKDRFRELCLRHLTDCSSAQVDDWYDDLRSLYSTPGRRYHTPEHVEHCLRQLDLIPNLVDDRDALEFAIWYHDAVYELDRNDNELKSARLFQRHVASCMPKQLVTTVYDLIMVTVHNDRKPTTGDQAFMVDIDLSSFGLPWRQFLEDSIAVRDEKPHLSDAEFYARQSAFLRSLLERPHFCLTLFFRERHEQQARSNISRYLHKLESEGLIDG